MPSLTLCRDEAFNIEGPGEKDTLQEAKNAGRIKGGYGGRELRDAMSYNESIIFLSGSR